MNAQLPLRRAGQRVLNAWDTRSDVSEASAAMEDLRSALRADEPTPVPENSAEARRRRIADAQQRARDAARA